MASSVVLTAAALVALLASAVLGQGSTPEPSTSPGVEAGPDVGQLPHDAPHLEAFLPSAFEGTTLFVISIGPESLALLGPDALGPMRALSERLGANPTDIEMAVANDPTRVTGDGGLDMSGMFNLFALRIAGVEPEALERTYGEVAQATEIDATLERVSIDGRDATHLHAPYNPIPEVWFWAVGDVLFGVQAGTVALGEQLIPLLPAGSSQDDA